MPAPLLLDINSVDRLIETVRQYSNLEGGDDTIVRTLADHDFSDLVPFEMAVLGSYGPNSTLGLEPRSKTPTAWVHAGENTETFNQARFNRLADALSGIELSFETDATCIADRDGITHLLAGEHDTQALFDPIACGQGITMPGHPQNTTPTCPACRTARAVGGNTVALLDEMAHLLGELQTRKTFPNSRRDIADKQIALIEAAGVRPRRTIFEATVSHYISNLGARLEAPLPELYRAFFRWNVSVFAAHGAQYSTSFPMKKQSLDLIGRCRTELGETD